MSFDTKDFEQTVSILKKSHGLEWAGDETEEALAEIKRLQTLLSEKEEEIASRLLGSLEELSIGVGVERGESYEESKRHFDTLRRKFEADRDWSLLSIAREDASEAWRIVRTREEEKKTLEKKTKRKDEEIIILSKVLSEVVLLCNEDGSPCDGFRFRELVLEARDVLKKMKLR